jgi:hypothetical protein
MDVGLGSPASAKEVHPFRIQGQVDETAGPETELFWCDHG